MKFSNNVSAAFSPGLHGQILEPGNLIFLINFSRTESDEFIALFSLSLLSISLNWKTTLSWSYAVSYTHLTLPTKRIV